MRVIAGIIILIMYYKNAFWSAFMPINSNGAFDNHMHSYNVSKVLTEENHVNIDAYKSYGPPYYAIANLFVTGANFVYYTFSIVYVFVKYRAALKKAFVGIVVNTIKRRSIYTGFDDGHARMMRRYKEVPEWWVGSWRLCKQDKYRWLTTTDDSTGSSSPSGLPYLLLPLQPGRHKRRGTRYSPSPPSAACSPSLG